MNQYGPFWKTNDDDTLAIATALVREGAEENRIVVSNCDTCTAYGRIALLPTNHQPYWPLGTSSRKAASEPTKPRIMRNRPPRMMPA
mmetsp:Transcript_33797/g.99590  ORF Transcript_33797/g.99590 Transcript_33797/m.99590 type:complete len:87 (-) Transcript_33797:1443-1703(-)